MSAQLWALAVAGVVVLAAACLEIFRARRARNKTRGAGERSLHPLLHGRGLHRVPHPPGASARETGRGPHRQGRRDRGSDDGRPLQRVHASDHGRDDAAGPGVARQLRLRDGSKAGAPAGRSPRRGARGRYRVVGILAGVIRRIALVALLLFAAAACAQSQASTGSDLVVGAIYPLSGPQALGGKAELAGVRAALEVAQSTGAVTTHVRLQVIDATTPQAASAAVDTLVRDYHVPAILGTYGSTLSTAASLRAEQLKTVYWETGAVADPITAQRRYVFRTVATGSSLGRMAVTFTHDVLLPTMKVSSPRVVVVQVDDIYGRSVGGGEQSFAKDLGIPVVDVIEYDPHGYDANAIAARVASDQPDFLWDVSYLDDGVAIWQALLRQHVSFKGAVGTSSAFCMPAFSERLGTA